MKNLKYAWVLISLYSVTACHIHAQKTTGMVKDAAFDKTITGLLDFEVTAISVSDLQKMKEVLLLDAREEEEFAVSHIPGAVHIGYNHWSKEAVKNINMEKKIVVYCSVGYRSEKIGKKLKDLGFENVYNLYGSIFEWANQGLPLESSDGSKTNKIHTYNKNWSKWVLNKEILKVW
ncbi:MAG: rhodanese-like domain-containing protein [Saprospiraceae bacterium]|nr:rhodanese-like domain-containing protein [Saprospiraceae bacterium]